MAVLALNTRTIDLDKIDLIDENGEATNRLAKELQDSGVFADLFARIDSGEVELTDDGELIPALIKTTLERGLEAEMTPFGLRCGRSGIQGSRGDREL